MSNHVIILHIWPGMTVAQLKLMLSEPTTKGVVMYTYGAGNFPMVDEMLDVLKDAIKQGVVSLSLHCVEAAWCPVLSGTRSCDRSW